MERNLVERLPFLKDVFVSLDHPLSAEALIEPPVVVPATNALSTVVIVPHSGPSVSVEDYENPDLVDVVPKNVTLGPEGEENIDASTGGRRWLLTHGMKLLMAKCLNSTKYIKVLRNAFGRAIEKGMQEGLAAGIEHKQAGRCLTDLEDYIPSAEVDFNSAVCDLRGLNFPLLQELSNKKDASTWDVMNLLRLDDAVAEALGMTDLQHDVNQLMVPVHHK
ncbi:hypothetical protein Tco_0179144 [Tanacetum coccineum]